MTEMASDAGLEKTNSLFEHLTRRLFRIACARHHEYKD